MQGVAACYHAFGVEQIARWAHAFYCVHPHGMAAQEPEREGRIKQRHINATAVGRAGHHILVACSSQQGAACEVVQNGVVLYLAEHRHVGNGQRGRVGTRQDGLPRAVQLLPIVRFRPMVTAVGGKLGVLLANVVHIVEEVLTVELHKCEEVN